MLNHNQLCQACNWVKMMTGLSQKRVGHTMWREHVTGLFKIGNLDLDNLLKNRRVEQYGPSHVSLTFSV